MLRASDDQAAVEGFRSVASWLAATQRRDRRAAAADERLAEALGERWTATADAVRQGGISLEQARVVVRGLDDLADALDQERRACLDELDQARDGTPVTQAWLADVLDRAEAHLLGSAADHSPEELRRLSERLLSVVCPDAADELERRALERAERRALAETRLTMRPRGDGSTDVSMRIPDLTAHQLRGYLHSLTAPRVCTGEQGGGGGVEPWIDPATGRRVPHDHRLGQAFCALMERIDPDRLPRHGGAAATVTVTIDLDDLRRDTGFGSVGDPEGDGVRLSPSEVRRLACTSAIVPAVLGGASEVLDLGRSRRLFSAAQRRAQAIRHRVCQASGCTTPAEWCESHHKRDPWSRGGRTDLADLALLCPWHHHRAHDPAGAVEWSSSGEARFHRRR